MIMLREGSRGQTPGYSHRFIGAIAVLAGIVVIGVPFLDRLAISQPLIHSIGRSRDTTVADATHGDFPEVAWLMTFPNSGTTYTLQLIQQYTNTTTATNYGNEQGVHGTSVPVHPWMENGPFFRYPEWNVPSRYILTKTHCGGTAMSPTPTDYIETARSFEIACRSGNRIVDDTKVEVVYSMDIPKRAVHLFRNPFDVSILVALAHMPLVFFR